MVERGIQSPNLVALFKIATILQVPASDLIARTESALGSTPAPKCGPPITGYPDRPQSVIHSFLFILFAISLLIFS